MPAPEAEAAGRTERSAPPHPRFQAQEEGPGGCGPDAVQRAAPAAGPRREGMRGARTDTPTGRPRLRPRPHLSSGPADADGRRSRLGYRRGAGARLPRTLAPPLPRRDVAVAVGACAPDSEGGGLPRPVSLVTCTPPSPPPSHTHLAGTAVPTDDDAHSYLQQTRTPPDREGGEAQRRPLAPSTGEVSQFSCPRGPGSEDETG